MKCGTKIKARDLVPLFSWIFLRGKCRSCGEKISPRYPLIEALNAVLYIVTFTIMDINVHSILLCMFFSLLIVIALIDWDTMEMNISLLILIALLGVVSIIFTNNLTLVEHITGALYISVPFFLIGEISGYIIKRQTGEKIRGIELGDTILMACAGLLVGHKAIIVSAFAGILLAAIAGIISKAKTHESKLPFGPFLAIGLVIGSLFGNQIVNWYISIFMTY
jgi:leader peptidase (prepilin peptidase)/N-methyltransferase